MRSIFILLSIYLIKSIQGLDCGDSSCFNYNLDSVNYQASSNAYCYTYSTSIDASCTVDGTARILFGIDTNECYINTNDLSSKITSTSPLTHTIKEDDTSGIIGLEFEITDQIIFCIKGIPANAETTTAPLQFSDNTNKCPFSAPSMPNFCGICDGDFAGNSCFCSNTIDECSNSGRPRGDLQCEWDRDNARCIATDALECINLPEEFRPCVCFWTEDECNTFKIEGGRDDCDWDERNQICSPSDCIADNLNCPCFEFKQDCESNEIIDFPQECIWTDDDECVEIPRFSTTEQDIEDTDCVGECGCFENEIDCTFQRELGELNCVWMDECVEAIPTSPPTTDEIISRVPTTAEPTRNRRTRTPSISTTWSKTTKGWNKSWNKGWNKSKGKGGRNKGRKGGRP